MSRLLALLACGVLLTVPPGCLGAPEGRAAVRPGRSIPTDVVRARQRLRAHDTDGALALLAACRPLTAAEPERSWLLAHVLRERSEGPRARALARALERGTFRTALVASLEEDPEAGLADVRGALRHARSPWLHLAAAYLHRMRGEEEAAVDQAVRARAWGVTFVDVEARLVEARAHLEEGRLARAAASAAAASACAPEDVRAYTIAAIAARRDGETLEAAAYRLSALRWVPDSEGQARGLADLLRRNDEDALAIRIGEGLTEVPPVPNAEREALEGLLAERRGDDDAAAKHYEAALEHGANPIPVERDLRGLLARRGAHARVVTLLERSVPAEVRQDPGNLLRGAWVELRAAVVRAPDAGADDASRLRLARALRDLGALREAREVLGTDPGSTCIDLAARLDAHRVFVDAFASALEGGYRQGDRNEDAPGFAAVLRTLASLARQHLPADEAAAFDDVAAGTRNVPLLATWLDHSTDTSSPVVAYFRRYGTYLVLGRRGEQPPEAVLLALASLTRDQEIRTRGHRFVHDVAIGYDRRLRSFLTSLGGDLGGACLPDGIWMDADSTRALEHDIRRIGVRDPSWIRRVRAAPRLVRADTPRGVLAMGETAGAGMRLLLRYLERRPDDRWGSYRTLCAHEFGHLVEIRRHLPIGRGLGASARLFLSSGLSASLAEQTLEMRAQLAAVAASGDPDLALAEMVLMVPVTTTAPDPHAGGYARGLERFLRHVYARPDLYPQIDRSHRILPQLDRLTNEQIRGAAEAILTK